MVETRVPNWDKWLQIPHVTLWQGVALSLSIEPDRINSHPQSWMAGEVLFQEGKEFDDRLDILRANLHRTIEPTAWSSGGLNRPLVSLHVFAVWAANAKWNLPHELQALAAEVSAKASSKSEVVEAVLGRLVTDFQKMLQQEIARRRKQGDEHGADALHAALGELNTLLRERITGLENPRAATEAAPEPAHRWPWGDYQTTLLTTMADAGDRFWKLYDPSDSTTAPKNQQVVDWLKERNVAVRTAEVMATILRADGLRTGPRK